MKLTFGNTSKIISTICAVLLLTGAMAASCLAQENHEGQTASVDNNAMGPYRALAQLAYREFQKGDHPVAAELARILERTWDQGEGGGADKSLQKINQQAYEQADGAMDAFIKPIINYAEKTPNAASVEAAYKTYLEKLKQADSATGASGMPQATHLSPEVLKTFTGKYQPPLPPDAPAGTTRPPIEITADNDGLWLIRTMLDKSPGGEVVTREQKYQFLPFSRWEFFSQEHPEVRIIFTKNEQGRVTGFTTIGFPRLPKATKLP